MKTTITIDKLITDINLLLSSTNEYTKDWKDLMIAYHYLNLDRNEEYRMDCRKYMSVVMFSIVLRVYVRWRLEAQSLTIPQK